MANHGNERKTDLFQPNKGRFAEETEGNISLAKAGKLKSRNAWTGLESNEMMEMMVF